MTDTIREYLVRTPDGCDYGRDASLDDAKDAADRLGAGAKVIALDDLLLPIRDAEGFEQVVYLAGREQAEEASSIPCPYHRCRYKATSEADLDEHLIAMPTDASEHWREDDDVLPRRKRGMFAGQFTAP